ncbi:MAG: gluconate 2-dehydrogenase subunit 3 family protein [Bryobacterales bacterium]|nr:gluconate 2-dehydrogenase subunit 3 family protein [Bryobacterales bacterium]
MNRRDLFRVGASGAAATALQAQHQHPVSPTSTRQANDAAWAPAVFDRHQNETVIALTECIIPQTDTPGAKAANVNRYMDLFLRDGEAQRRQQFLEGLSWIDGYCIRRAQAPFVRLPESTQVEMLQALDVGGDPTLETGHAFFRMLKTMTASIYYATEIGFQELNKGGRVPTGFGCDGKNNA